MTWTRRRLKIRFDSDWHIGSGAGIPGSVDRQVLRDEDGLPYIPGKTITGVLRDAAEWIAYIRQDVRGDGKDWKGALAELFGEQQPEPGGGKDGNPARPAKIGVSSAEIAPEVRSYILDADNQINISFSFYTVHPGVKINPETGRAEDNHLFSTERARSDCILYADVLFMDEVSEDGKKLLDDAVKAVRRIGGKRRRGAGECSFEWVGDPVQEQAVEKSLNLSRDANGSVTLDIRLTTLQPLIIARTTLGNEVRSDVEIPGAMIFAYYLEKVLSPLGRERLQSAAMNGEITVSGFLPEVDEQRAMPVPLCIGELKERKTPINRLVSFSEENEQIKDLRSGYITVSNGKMVYHSGGGQRIIRTHNTVDDSVQRPTKDVVGLFTYEAIQAGQKFRGTVCIQSALWDDIEKLPEDGKARIFSCLVHDWHTFGRSRKDEYGNAELECVTSQTGEEPGSTVLLDGRNGSAHGKYLVIYLLSDLLLRGEYNDFSARMEDVKTALSDKLGVDLEDIPDEEWKEEWRDERYFRLSPLNGTHGHCVRVERRESWQVSWALPRPSLVFFKAGSLFMYKVSAPEKWNENSARTLMKEGLGERKAEGYGRLLLNPPFLLNGAVDRVSSPHRTSPAKSDNIQLPENDEDRKFAIALAKDSLKRHFRTMARYEAYDILRSKKSAPFTGFNDVQWAKRPGASQFGGLREAAASLTDKEGGTERFLEWADNLTRPDVEKQYWDMPWIRMFRDMAKNPHLVWNLRESFFELRQSFERILPAEEILSLSASSLGGFLDVLCEAVFDEKKGQDNKGDDNA